MKRIVAILLLVAVVVVGVVLNINHTKSDATKIISAIDVDNGDLKINWGRYQTVDIELSESVTIAESGTYHITGTLTNGMIKVQAGVGEVRLILDNATIKNNTGPAILCASAEDLVIELVGDNTLEDGGSYANDYDEDVSGAIYSKADLTFQGEGTLNITANYLDAIVGKDDVKFNGGIYNIVAKDDGIRGKDSVYIVDGKFNINTVADAIKSTNETDNGKGFVLIENGDFEIATSAKGVKATNSILIYNGNFVIESYDDAIHSNNYVGIIDGDYSIDSGDDGVHADRELIIDGGNVEIKKSYEGLEAQVVTVNGGNLHIAASDDGMNAGGGADGSANNRPGAGAFDADLNCVLSVNGGNIYVNAAGDGIDSNGYVYFNGGNVVVDGPTNNGNGALDSGAGIIMSGGTVVAVGSSGMAETLGDASSVLNISVYFSSTQAAQTSIEIKDSAGETILSHTATKTFNHLAAGSEKFVLGETYTIYINGERYQDFKISNITTTVGNSSVNQYNMPGGAPGTNGRQTRQ